MSAIATSTADNLSNVGGGGSDSASASAATKSTQVVTVVLTVAFFITALACAAFAVVAVDSSVRPFMACLSVALAAVSIARFVGVANAASLLQAKHEELAKVQPTGCPDYWTSSWSGCSGMTCSPYFDAKSADANGVPIRKRYHMAAAATPISLKDINAMPASDVCNAYSAENRKYAWTELTNSCTARALA